MSIENAVEVVVVVEIDGDFYNLLVSTEIAEKYETLKAEISAGKKPSLNERDFIFSLKTRALKSALKEAKKVDNSKKSEVTRALLISRIIVENPSKINDLDFLESEADKISRNFRIEPNSSETRKFNYPKVRDAFKAVAEKYGPLDALKDRAERAEKNLKESFDDEKIYRKLRAEYLEAK